MQAAACGTSYKVRGDVFLLKLRLEDGALLLQESAAPEMITERSWLEAAQEAHKCDCSAVCDDLVTLGARYLEVACTHFLEKAPNQDSLAEGGGDSNFGEMRWEDDGANVTVSVLVPLETKANDVVCGLSGGILQLQVKTIDTTIWAKKFPPNGARLFGPVEDFNWSLETSKNIKRLNVELEKPDGQQSRWLALIR